MLWKKSEYSDICGIWQEFEYCVIQSCPCFSLLLGQLIDCTNFLFSDAGTGEITNQLEYDEEVAFLATQKLYQLCRKTTERRPWCLTVSFTHPHDPYVTRPPFWDLYKDCEHLLPSVESIPFAQQDPHSERLLNACDYQNFNITQDDIMRSRRAYFGNISFIDERVCTILNTLNESAKFPF